MEHGSHEDVTSTLSELERKLKELEQELESVGRGGETSVEPAQAAWAPAPDAGALPQPEPGPPPAGATPVTAEWHGGTQPPPQPTFHAAVPPPPQPPRAEPLPPAPSQVTEWRTYATPTPPPPAPAAPAAVAPESEAPSAAPEPGAEAPAATPQPESVAPSAATEPASEAPASAPQQAPAPAAAPAQPAGSRLDELLRVREELVQTADRLVVELQRVLEELGAAPGGAPVEPEEPRLLQSGRVAVEAEPFPDLASLSSFEQALAQTPGVADVYVRSLDSGRARLEVELEHPMALSMELRGCSPIEFEVVAESEDVVTLRLEAP